MSLAACGREEAPPPTAADCLPTLGDHCDCYRKCMTQDDIDEIDSRCDLGCAMPLDWACTVVDGECAVADSGL
jgi:hypothetical protein